LNFVVAIAHHGAGTTSSYQDYAGLPKCLS
jgi:hypothetical protein